MKPQELINKLQQLLTDKKIDPDADVIIEGCDCWNKSVDVQPMHEYHTRHSTDTTAIITCESTQHSYSHE